MPTQLEQVLDSVSDAVSAIVLFASESDESGTDMPNLVPGVEALGNAVGFLVNAAKKPADMWATIGRFDMQESMNKAGASLEESTKSLATAARDLKEFPNHRPSKKIVLKSCKDIMSHTVTLVQLADLYDVQKLIREANDCAKASKKLIETPSVAAGFVQNVTEYVTVAAEVARLCFKRVQNIEVGEIADRLKKSGDIMKAETEHFMSAVKNSLLSHGDPDKKEEANRIFKIIIDTLNQIIADARLTARSPFDLSMLEGAEFIDYTLSTAGMVPDDAVLRGHIGLSKALQAYREALQYGTAKEIADAKSALEIELGKQAQNALSIAQMCDDPEVRRKLEAAAARLQANLDELLRNAQNAANLQHWAELDEYMNAIKSSSAQIVAYGAKGLLQQSEMRLAYALDDLEFAVKRGNAKQAVENLKTITKEINLQADIARAIADGESQDMDVMRKLKIREEAANLEAMPTELVTTSKKGLANKNDMDAQKHLVELINETKERSHALVSMSTMSPSAELLDTAELVDQQLNLIDAFLTADNVPVSELALKVKNLAKAAIKETELADQIAESVTDSLRKQTIQAASEGMRRHATALVQATKAVVANEPGARQMMQSLVDSASQANVRIVQATALRPDDLMIALEEEIIANIDHLNRAVKEGTDEEVKRAQAALQRSLNKQKILATAIADKCDDQMQKKQIEKALEELEAIYTQIPNQVNLVRSQPGVKAHFDKLQTLFQQTKEGVSKVTQAASSSPEDRILATAQKFQSQATRLQSALKNSQTEEAKQLVGDMKNTLASAAQIAITLSDNHPLNRKQILEESALLDELQFKLEEAVNDAVLKGAVSKDGIQKVDAVIDEGMTGFRKIISLTQAQPEKALEENNKMLEDELDKLVRAVKKGDEAEAYVALRHAKNKIAQQCLLAQVLAENASDPSIRDRLLATASKLAKLTDELDSSVKKALANPNELPELIRVVGEIKQHSNSLVGLGKENIAVIERKKREEEERIKREIAEKKRREEEARLEAIRVEQERLRKEEEARLEKIRLEAERVRQEQEKARIEKLAMEKAELEKRLEEERIEAERKKREEAERLEKLRKEEAERQERIRKEEAERKKREEEQLARDEVFAAAQAVTERVESVKGTLGLDFPEFTGEGKLVDLARQIAELMKQMSIAAKNNNKAEMIRIAQQIAGMVKAIISQATEQAKNCTDPILADNLARAAQSVQSFSIQLKIISAVKAATEGDHKSAKAQLIKCAQGLCGGVINTVNAAESAALRSKDRKKK